jgi:nucleolar protein 6
MSSEVALDNPVVTGAADAPAADAPAVETKKLSKKEKKALEFKAKKKNPEAAAAAEEKKQLKRKRQAEEAEQKATAEKAGAANKKQKKQNKFILFVGNLPYQYDTSRLETHFKACMPFSVRKRENSGFAFLEFTSTDSADDDKVPDASKRLKTALRLHHSMFMNRRINVELTAGGGGNSAKRRGKIQEKRDKVATETQERLREEAVAREKKEKAAKRQEQKERKRERSDGTLTSGVHPSRMKRIH